MSTNTNCSSRDLPRSETHTDINVTLLTVSTLLWQHTDIRRYILTERQKGEPVGGHGELVEAVEQAELPGNVAQQVVVGGQILQGNTAVQPIW